MYMYGTVYTLYLHVAFHPSSMNTASIVVDTYMYMVQVETENGNGKLKRKTEAEIGNGTFVHA